MWRLSWWRRSKVRAVWWSRRRTTCAACVTCARARGALMVDEVQTGFGRTGEWFAFQHEHLEPDVVTMAKALGNGMPVGACWARAEVAAAMVPGDHGSTFGGQPLAMAAVRATLGVMEAEMSAAGPRPPAHGCVTASLTRRDRRGPRTGPAAGCTAHGRRRRCRQCGLPRSGAARQRRASRCAALQPLAPRGQRADRCGPRHRGGRARGPPARRCAMSRHFLELDDVSAVELDQILAMAEAAELGPVLAGNGVALVFEKPSNRTETRPRWQSSASGAIRSTSRATRWVSTCGSRQQTWRAPLRPTTASSAPGSSTTAPSSVWRTPSTAMALRCRS